MRRSPFPNAAQGDTTHPGPVSVAAGGVESGRGDDLAKKIAEGGGIGI